MSTAENLKCMVTYLPLQSSIYNIYLSALTVGGGMRVKMGGKEVFLNF